MSNDASSVAPSAYLGRRLGEFELGEKIGKGGVGSIYRAEQVGLGRQAIVKILQSRFAHDETTKLRFLREARLASAIDHPYAAHIYAFGAEPDGVHWIAMELVRGSTLADVVRTRGMTLSTFVPFLERLCQVVQTAHDHGIVHRDIKPQNVMVIERAGALLPKLLDLGIAKDTARLADATLRVRAQPGAGSGMRWVGAREDDAPPAEADAGDSITSPPRGARRDDELLTVAGDVIGSPAYMAPEQWDNADQVDARCDVYALGVLA